MPFRSLYIVCNSANSTLSRGHYDVLYKLEDLPQPPVPQANTTQNLLVALNHDTPEMTHHRTAFHPDIIEIPGMSFYAGPNAGWPAFAQYDISTSPIVAPTTSPRAAPTPSYPGVPPAHPQDVFIPTLPIPQPSVPSLTLAHHPPIDRGGPFRPSMYEYKTDYASPNLCQTAIFRK